MPSAPYSAPVQQLVYLPCSGDVPGSLYVAAGAVIAVTWNGIFLPRGSGPGKNFTAADKLVTLSFATQVGDRIDALCILVP
jgi:hypothetical protein